MSGMGTRWRALPLVVRDGLLALVPSVVGQVELLVLADVRLTVTGRALPAAVPVAA